MSSRGRELTVSKAFRVKVTNRPKEHPHKPAQLDVLKGVFSAELKPARKAETQWFVFRNGPPETTERNQLGYLQRFFNHDSQAITPDPPGQLTAEVWPGRLADCKPACAQFLTKN